MIETLQDLWRRRDQWDDELVAWATSIPTLRERGAERVAFGLLVLALLGLVHGTLAVGSHPSWPRPGVWAALALLAACGCGMAVIDPRYPKQGVALFLVFAVSLIRGLGYVVAPSARVGFNGAAVGAYGLTVGLSVLLGVHWWKARQARLI